MSHPDRIKLQGKNESPVIILKKFGTSENRWHKYYHNRRIARFILLCMLLLSVSVWMIFKHYHGIHTENQGPQLSESLSNGRIIAGALIRYKKDKGAFPPAYACNMMGEPTLSWRVLLLPYYDDPSLNDLYKAFNLQKTWDSPENIQLLSLMPAFYRSPASKLPKPESIASLTGGNEIFHPKKNTSEKNTSPEEDSFPGVSGETSTYSEEDTYRTNYVSIRHPDSLFPGGNIIRETDVTDLQSETVAFLEVADSAAVPWTAPEDYEYDPEFPAKSSPDSFYPEGLVCIMASGICSFQTTPQTDTLTIREPARGENAVGQIRERHLGEFTAWRNLFFRNAQERKMQEIQELETNAQYEADIAIQKKYDALTDPTEDEYVSPSRKRKRPHSRDTSPESSPSLLTSEAPKDIKAVVETSLPTREEKSLESPTTLEGTVSEENKSLPTSSGESNALPESDEMLPVLPEL